MGVVERGAAPRLEVCGGQGRTCLCADVGERSVSFAFVGRTGGVSEGPWHSLNVGDRCGDDPAAVAENRRRALREIGADGREPLVAHQVHGSEVVCIPARADMGGVVRACAAGADGIVCAKSGLPVMLSFADCVPVVLVAPSAFAVVHSGWRGTLARISRLAARLLSELSGCAPERLWAYIGPHIGPASYEVSGELLARFAHAFGKSVVAGERLLDLGAAVRETLVGTGVEAGNVVTADVDTATSTAHWFSHRASGGRCGRHAAVAWVVPTEVEGS